MTSPKIDEGSALSPTEKRILIQILLGETMAGCSKSLDLVPRTLYARCFDVRKKLGAKTLGHALAIAIKRKIIKIPEEIV